MQELQFSKRKEPTVQLVPECQLRLQLIELAIRGGATIDNAERVARDWESYVGELSDPLRLDTPSPCNGNCGTNYCDENGCIDKKEVVGSPAQMEVGWSRPQLVNNGLGLIVRTNGFHGGRNFEGAVVEVGTSSHSVGDTSNEWLKSVFVYHGEIPQEQQEGPKTTGLNFLEAVNMNINGHAIKRDGWSGSWMPQAWPKPDEYARLPLCDILATDWQIIEP